MLIRPQKRTVQIVDHAVAIRPKDRHIARCRNQLRLTFRLSGLGPTRGKTDGTTRAHRGKFGNHLTRGKAIHPDEGGIGGLGQIGQRGIGAQPANLGLDVYKRQVPPASRTVTRCLPDSVSRFASTDPAEPEPTMM